MPGAGVALSRPLSVCGSLTGVPRVSAPFSMEEQGARVRAQLDAQSFAARNPEVEGSFPQWWEWCLPRQQAIVHSGSPDAPRRVARGAGPNRRISAPAIMLRAKLRRLPGTVLIISPEPPWHRRSFFVACLNEPSAPGPVGGSSSPARKGGDEWCVIFRPCLSAAPDGLSHGHKLHLLTCAAYGTSRISPHITWYASMFP
jgi:hypothetical protein